MTALHPTDFPGTQAAAIKAVLSGGASPHRLSLAETLLVFAEHRTTRPRDVAVTLESA
jgi:molybdenum transport protein